MKNQIKQLLKSGKFMVGFIVFMSILLFITIYPFFVPGNPLQMIGYNSFIPPGTYLSLYDAVNPNVFVYTLRIPGAAEARIVNTLPMSDREAMRDWLVRAGMPEAAIDIYDPETLLALWNANYDPDERIEGMILADHRAYQRLNNRIQGMFDASALRLYSADPETGEPQFQAPITDTDYIALSDIVNIRRLPLGTDNFGRDMLKQLVQAIGVSLRIGLIAGSIATAIGLLLGLVAGYVGGWVDEIIMFICNLLTVIPGFVLLVLLAFSIGPAGRSVTIVGIVIGLTTWVWTTRAVRSQVLSLRNRDHVNLSKLSGHSLPRIVFKDILPYIASYVVMAFILQVSGAILAEAGLSMLGLGPSTTEVATLGLMMNWAMSFSAHIMGAWWAYFPVVFVIALISFSLNLMNTGMDQIFNPQLRD
ncbi:MAG: ABC transporter permease [Oscillospiraceae bacterium]|nr:ABC transporter permease [Oscillospiraceae bacterium]MCL2278777.1 ABC transporter permease [Oscillospiraceae bacterium]